MRIFWYEINKQAPIEKKKSYYINNSSISLKTLFDHDVVLDNNTFYVLYQKNGDVRQAVKKIAENVARNWLYLTDNQWNIVDDNKFTDDIQLLFSAPTFSKFKIDVFRNYLISGEVYIMPVKNIRGETAWFRVIDSRMVVKNIDIKKNIIASFDLYLWGNEHIELKPNELAFFKLEDDIYNQFNWMWLLTWIVYDWLSDLEAMKNNYFFYQNSAIPSALLILDENLSNDEMQMVKDQFDAQFKWSQNNHKTMLAWWIKDIKTLSMTPRDMEFINQRNLTTEKVSAVFWVPKTILWYTNNVNYSNGQTLRKEFIEWTIRPYEKDFEYMLNKCLQMFRPDIAEKYRVKADWDQFEQTQEEKQTQVEDIRHWIRTINEIRVERWYQKSDDENADKLLIRNDLWLLEDIVFNSVMWVNGQEEWNSNENDTNKEWKQSDEENSQWVSENEKDNGE